MNTNPTTTSPSRTSRRSSERRSGRFASSTSGGTFPLYIGGQRVEGGESYEVRNPADPREVVWRFPKATAEQRDAALTAAQHAFETWRFSDPFQRASIFKRAAELLQARRMEFNAVMTLENGKNWAEADGEVAESVDHFEVFARETLRWAEGKPVYPMPDEHVTTIYEPLGVVVCISPWNFPECHSAGHGAGRTGGRQHRDLETGFRNAAVEPVDAGTPVRGRPPQRRIQFLTGTDDVLGDPLVDSPRSA